MAGRKPTLRVIYSYDAGEELKGIYAYDAKHRSPAQAAQYEAFLVAHIDKLAKTYDYGRPVEGFPELRKIILKPSSRGHGHYVIYEVDLTAKSINILHIFHTRMDVEGRLKENLQ